MAKITDVVKSPIQGKTGTINRSSGYEYRDFWYTNSSGQKVHVVGWHRAVDITTLGTVVAFAKGKVVALVKGITGQTTNPSSGNCVTLLHANGCKSTYCHLDNGSNDHLKIGDIVEEGAKLGTDIKKTTGNSTGLHLHFAIYDPNQIYKGSSTDVGSHYMNPIDYMQGKKVLKGYEPLPQITPTVARDKTKNQLETNTSMNVRVNIETTSTSLGVVPKGNIYNYYEEKQGKSSKWYAITEDKSQWMAGTNNDGTKYCNIYPAEAPTPIITPNVDRDINKNQLEVKITVLRVRTDAGTDKKILGFAHVGYYNYYDTKQASGYTWYKIAENQWLASDPDWTTIYPANPPEPTELKVGDKVKITGFGNASSYGDSWRAGGIGWERTILKIWVGRRYPYQVGNSTGTTGFYKADALEKI